jgi:hypothetical protein
MIDRCSTLAPEAHLAMDNATTASPPAATAADVSAVVLRRESGVRLERRPAPHPGPTDLLVRPEFVGVCGTDLELLSGTSTATSPSATRSSSGTSGPEPCWPSAARSPGSPPGIW